MSAQTKPKYHPEEYLALERTSDNKHEYFNGEIFAMAGASERHNLIVTNLVREISSQLKEVPCKTYANDMRIKVSPTGLYTYPDVLVVCGQAIFDDDQKDTLLNPIVIVEVLSESTEGYDRGKKFEHYRSLESLSDYILIAQDKVHAEHFVRQPGNQWLLSETNDLQDILTIPSISCKLALADIYHKIEMTENV